MQRPLELGFDLVVHSTTKYLNGHSDVIGGVVVTKSRELAEQLAFLQNAVGAIPSPFDGFLALRGLKTLALRMERHCANAQAIAARLERHPKVERVRYPGLPSHPQHALAKRQMNGFGGMVSMELKADLAGTRRFLERCELFALAESLGGVESLIEHPAIMTHALAAGGRARALGIGDNLVRLSVGIEDVDDLAPISSRRSRRPSRIAGYARSRLSISSSSAAAANARMFATRSSLAVSSVIARSTLPTIAMHA